jgi:hypothetical protein
MGPPGLPAWEKKDSGDKWAPRAQRAVAGHLRRLQLDIALLHPAGAADE